MSFERFRNRRRPCGCSPSEAAALLEREAASALAGNRRSAKLLGTVIEHALQCGALA